MINFIKSFVKLVKICLSANYGYKNKLFQNLEDYEKTRK